MNEKEPFYMVPKGLAKKYGWTVAGVYAVLLDSCKPPIYEVTITRAEISDLSGIPVSTVRRNIEMLENIKLIERIGISGKANIYKVVPIVNARIHQQASARVPTPESEDQKQIYGQYQHVLLSVTEYQSLVKKFGDYKIKKYIDRVDKWVQKTGKPYNDYALVIAEWISEDKEKDKNDSHHLSDEEMEGYLKLVNRFPSEEEERELEMRHAKEQFMKTRPIPPTRYRMTQEEVARCEKGEYKFILDDPRHPLSNFLDIHLIELSKKWKKYYEEEAAWQKQKQSLYPEQT